MAKSVKPPRVSYAKSTQMITGMTPAQYKREFQTFSRRVANYNAVMGQHESAAQLFYNYKRFQNSPNGLSPILQAVAATPATRARTAGATPFARYGKSWGKISAAASGFVMQKWGGFMNPPRPTPTGKLYSGYALAVDGDISLYASKQISADELVQRLRDALAGGTGDDNGLAYKIGMAMRDGRIPPDVAQRLFREIDAHRSQIADDNPDYHY